MDLDGNQTMFVCVFIFDLQAKRAKSALAPAPDPGPEEGGPGHVPDTGDDWTQFRGRDREACCVLRQDWNGPNVSLQAHQEPIEAKVKFQKQEAHQEPAPEEHPLTRPGQADSE